MTLSFLHTSAIAFGLPLSALNRYHAVADQGMSGNDATVVLVHGAFSDGSAWDKVIPMLQSRGLKVISVQNPLTSLDDDVAATTRAIEAAIGSVVLVGHSWAGTVITQAGGHDKVVALVYVAAFAPSEGQSSAELGKDYPAPLGAPHKVVDAAGFVSLTPEGMANHFAHDLPAAQTKLMTVMQGPIRGANFEEPVTVAAWKTKPSWYIVAAQDHMIQPDLQRDLAKKINATVITVQASHVPHQSKAKEVADVILAAAEKTVR